MNNCTLEQFKQNEMLMRTIGMTVINIDELVKRILLMKSDSHTSTSRKKT